MKVKYGEGCEMASIARAPTKRDINKAQCAEIIAGLMWGAKTTFALAEYAGCCQWTADGWLKAFEAAGVVRRVGKVRLNETSRRKSVLWALAVTPFGEPRT